MDMETVSILNEGKKIHRHCEAPAGAAAIHYDLDAMDCLVDFVCSQWREESVSLDAIW